MTRASFGLVFCLLIAMTALASAKPLTGSGTPGFADGDSAHASFVEPLGLAVDASGNVLVADGGAQRIRLVRPDGTVSTVAGSGAMSADGLGVPGGYADGPAASARFDHPTDVAIDPAGAIVVADSRNHCLRKIKSGIVTTYAGSSKVQGGLNGDLTHATFHNPRGLAYAPDGTLYVADYGIGVRAVSPSGRVSTIAMPGVLGPNVISLAVTQSGDDLVLIATNGVQTVEFTVRTREWRLWSPNENDTNDRGFTAEMEGGRGSGTPVAITALGYNEIVYADPWHDGVDYINNQFITSLLEVGDDAPREPGGIAILPTGRVAVSDTAGRRIITLAGPDRRTFTDPRQLLPAKKPRVFRIAYIGNSYVYYGTTWADSVPGRIEKQLNDAAKRLHLPEPIEVIPVRFGPIQGIPDWIDEVSGDGLVDAVVLQLNSHFLYTSDYHLPAWEPVSQYENLWMKPFTATLQSIVDHVKQNKIPLAIVTHPIASEVGPTESVYTFEVLKEDGIDSGVYADSAAEMAKVSTQVGVSCLTDTTAAFDALVPFLKRRSCYEHKP